jgi:ABC-type Mn2+/Zn2+ transport system permease subunit
VRGATASYMVPRVFWPLLGGFIAFVLFALFMGWVMDTSRHGDGASDDGAGH